MAEPRALAIVIPALNEARSLGQVLADIPRAGPGWALREIVVADNGSSDGTAEVARAAGATVVLEPRRGYGAACLAGIARLRSDPPEWIAFLDADHSDDPTELPVLLAPLVEGRADLVIGSRVLGEPEAGSLTPVQSFGNALAAWLMGRLWGQRVSDLGPFRAIRWSALESLHMRDPDYGWTVEMQTRAFHAGLTVIEVPVRYRRRRAGRSKVAGTVQGALGAGWKILTTIGRVRLGG